MSTPSLQDGIDRAGSPLALLWKPNAAPWTPEVVEREYAGWRQEQAAWHTTVALLNLSHHMYDLFIEGPDALRLLSETGANDFGSFAVGQAKQFLPVTEAGHIVSDGILARDGLESFTLSGIPAAQHWVRYHGERGGYDVSFRTDPSSAFRSDGGDPVLFRYQVQGPLAGQLVESVFGGPMPPVKFFHSHPVELGGRRFKALRHGMAGQAGWEFLGPWEHAAAVEDALLTAGEPLGLVRVGALAYTTPSVESGWIPSPVPGIYTDPGLSDYRRYLPLFGIEGQRPLNGSHYTGDIEDYYCSPYELGYGKVVAFNHDFIGRDALEQAAAGGVRRRKVTLAFDAADVRRVIGAGEDPGFQLSYARNRVERAGSLVGVTMQTASIDPVGTILALTLIDEEAAGPGTEVEVVWGEHPGAAAPAGADPGFPRIRATVHPAPFNRHARTLYRRNA